MRLFPRSALVALALVGLAFPAGAFGRGEALPEGVPMLVAKERMPAPGWALKQRELLDISAEATRLMDRLCFRKDGFFKGTYEHGGGNLAPDDVFEFAGKGPLLYALGADEFVLEQWWRMFRASLRQCGEKGNGIFVNDMCKYLDWHHNAEHYQSFWTAALCMAEDPLYRELLLKFAGFFDGTNPKAPNYDPEKKVMRSMLTGGAGPILQAERKHWDARRGPFWDAWLECGHDGPVNLVTTNWGTLAYMLTGEAWRKRRTLEYLDAWRERARANGGIIPSIVDNSGAVPKEWWGGVMGWNFLPFGGLFQVSSGPRAGWANALLLTGDSSYYDSLRTMADGAWKNRKTDKRGILYLPRYLNDKGWFGRMGDNSMEGIYANVRANVWLATMKKEDLARSLECTIEGRAGHEDFHEGGLEGRWIRFLQGDNPEWPEKALDDNLARVRRQIDWLGKHLDDPKLREDGPDLWIQWRVGAGYCASLVQGMTGGVMPLWHGQLLMSRFRYLDPARRRPGIPPDCAALVDSLSNDHASVTLVNLHPKESREVLVQAGAYAEHRFLRVIPDGGKPREVEGGLFAVRLDPGAGKRYRVEMKRYANSPTLALPWTRK